MKVSIITATYNSEKNIHHCLQSIINQSYKDIEIVVIDGNSTDNTLQVIREIFKNIKIEYKLISESDSGIYDALNKGIKNSTGDIIGFLHSDDFFPSNYIIQSITNEFSKQKCDGLYANLNYVNSNKSDKITRVWIPALFKKYKLKYGWMAPHPTLYLTRHVYDEIGLFNTSYRISADYDFILRLFKSNFYKIHYLNKAIVHMRLGGASNKNIKNLLVKYKEDLHIIRRHKLFGFFTLIFKNLRKIDQFFK